MKMINTTSMRKNLSEVINQVKYRGQVFGVGRRNNIEVIVMKYPENFNKELSEITNANANSSSFNFLKNEPDLYNTDDLKKSYV